MGALRAPLLCAWLVWAEPATAGAMDRWAPYIREAAARFEVPETWIRRVIEAESGGRTMLRGRPIESSAGALGLMQLMPGTWRDMRVMHGLGRDPHDPRDNILAGAAYLRAMYARFGYPGLFAAYNAGPARYARHIATGGRLPLETVAYVAKVGGSSADPADPAQEASVPEPLFVILSADRLAASDRHLPAPHAAAAPIFVRLGGGATLRP